MDERDKMTCNLTKEIASQKESTKDIVAQKDDEIKRQNLILLNKPVPSKKITQIKIAPHSNKKSILKA